VAWLLPYLVSPVLDIAWDYADRLPTRKDASMKGNGKPAKRATTSRRETIAQGPVMPIGGAEDKDLDGDEWIHIRFLELAGGESARIAIIPTASGEPEQAAKRYIEVFTKLGAKDADWLRVKERSEANSDETLRVFEQATGIFITGGDQARLVALLGGTRVTECIRERNADGAIVAGTSAGASILPAHTMSGDTWVGGPANNAAARKGMVEVVASFGLMEEVIVDQHFSQRGRIGRLLVAMAANPGLIGFGLDEDTAMLIDRDGILETLGSNMVTIVDGREAVSDYFERTTGEVVTVTGSKLHALAAGHIFDLNTRQLIAETDAARQERARRGDVRRRQDAKQDEQEKAKEPVAAH
jgi:cyanophycinase